MSESDVRTVSHVWEGFYIRDHWDEPTGHVYATDEETAKELIAEEADVPNAGWEKNEHSDQPCYQLHRTTHHIVTVRRLPVKGLSDD